MPLSFASFLCFEICFDLEGAWTWFPVTYNTRWPAGCICLNLESLQGLDGLLPRLPALAFVARHWSSQEVDCCLWNSPKHCAWELCSKLAKNMSWDKNYAFFEHNFNLRLPRRCVRVWLCVWMLALNSNIGFSVKKITLNLSEHDEAKAGHFSNIRLLFFKVCHPSKFQ